MKNNRHLYLDIMDDITKKIQNGILTPGAPLPSERELCEGWGVSRTTVRQALRELGAQGYIVSLQGKGTFVSDDTIEQRTDAIYSFDADMRALGRTPHTKVLGFERECAGVKLAALFGGKAGDEVWRITRLRYADEKLMLCETNYLPTARFPSLTREMIDDRSLYAALRDNFALSLDTAEETFEPVILKQTETELFGVPEHSLGMLVERTSFENGKIVEYSKSVSPSCRFRHCVTLHKK